MGGTIMKQTLEEFELGALSMRTSIMRKMSAENIIQFGTPELL